jgi:hypothetical protein
MDVSGAITARPMNSREFYRCGIHALNINSEIQLRILKPDV